MKSDTGRRRGDAIVEFILGAHKYIGMWALGMWITYANLGDRLEDARIAVPAIVVLAIVLGIMTMLFTTWAAKSIRRIRR
ncbi:MAG: hypothetical protein JSW45_09985 [Thiotrichales bacterium]|nr:MAG: hypothetical protein JSW45_09985 [Thiotrichales bacterium]